MHQLYQKYLENRVIPVPREIKYGGEGFFRLSGGCPVETASPFSAAELHEILDSMLSGVRFQPEFRCRDLEETLPPEGYKLEVTPALCRIAAPDAAGIRNAFKTLWALSESERGVLTSTERIVPCMSIADYPDLSFRGIHFCLFPETPFAELEKRVYLAALYKFNYAVIESWGMIKLDSHPEYCWEEFAVGKREISRLVHTAAGMGMTLIPQFNVFGHASAARSVSGKHVLLDRHPEYAPLFEPDGWAWCLSNPETRKFLTDMVLELHELFDSPPYFHIGFDESYNAGSCLLCKENYGGKMLDHILYFHDLLQKRGAKIMMWHDMLVAKGDPRWTGEVAKGFVEIGCGDLLARLPKDVIICDWQYDFKGEVPPPWNTVTHFLENGFTVLPCPWSDEKTIDSLCAYAREHGLSGLLETTWHTTYISPQELVTQLKYVSQCFWNVAGRRPKAAAGGIYTRQYFNRDLRMVQHSMGLTEYKFLGTKPLQLLPGSSDR